MTLTGPDAAVELPPLEPAARYRMWVARLVPARFRPWTAVAAAMAWADIKRDGSRNFAGLLWWLADPLINLGVYYFVFTYVFPPTAPHFLVFLFLNLMVWRWLAVTLTQSSSSVLTAIGLLRQIYLPKAVLPLKFLLTESLAFSIGMVLVLAVIAVDPLPFHWTLSLLPLLAALTLAHIYALSVILSLLAPYIPDSTHILNFALRGLAMVSGVFFEPSILSDRLERIIYLNPWADLLESYRALVLRGELPRVSHVAYVAVITAALAVVALVLHRRLDRSITKVLR